MNIAALLKRCPQLIRNVVEESEHTATGQLNTDAGDIAIRVRISTAFPFELPQVGLLEEGIPVSPPQMPGGTICWQDGSGLVDHTDPLAMVSHMLERVRQLMNDSLHEREFDDVMAEYGSYWAFERKRHPVSVRSPQVSVPTPLVRAGGVLQQAYVPGSMAQAEAILVPLEKGLLPYPSPTGISVPWVHKAFHPLLSAKHRRMLSKMLRDSRIHTVVLQVPRENGLPLLLGLRFTFGRSNKHPFFNKADHATVERVYVANEDNDHLRLRGGASLAHKVHNVVLVGCGAVGAQLALDLVRSGVKRLMLIDPDTLGAENTFRHILGSGNPWGGTKVEQLAHHLRTHFPGTGVHAVAQRIQDVLPEPQLAGADAVVVAIDQPAAIQAVNKWAYSQSIDTVVYAWLEAHGIASHVLRTHAPTPGCFECLVRSSTGGLRDNRAHLAAAGQDFTLNQAGCGGRYVPFGAVHATRTAALAAEEVLKGLCGDRNGRLTTQTGEFKAFIEAGFELSERVELLRDSELHRLPSEDLAVATCPVCAR